MDNHWIIASSAWRKSAVVCGVGLILNSAEKSLCEVVTLSNRIMRASFSGNPASTILSIHSQTNYKGNESEADSFYDLIRQEVVDSPPHNFLAILGDWNAKVNNAHVKHTYDKRTNENGLKMLDLACEQSLCITNTMLEKRKANAGPSRIQRGIIFSSITFW